MVETILKQLQKDPWIEAYHQKNPQLGHPTPLLESLALASGFKESKLVVKANRYQANQLVNALSNLVPTTFFSLDDQTSLQALAYSNEESQLFIAQMLDYLKDEQARIIVTTVNTLTTYLPSRQDFLASCLNLTCGQSITMDDLCAHLVNQGYERVQFVDQVGQFAKRGGIVDIFPVNEVHPVRIEFFDTEIDSLRQFSILTQRTITTLTKAMIPPAQIQASNATLLDYVQAPIIFSDVQAIQAQYQHQLDNINHELASLPEPDQVIQSFSQIESQIEALEPLEASQHRDENAYYSINELQQKTLQAKHFLNETFTLGFRYQDITVYTARELFVKPVVRYEKSFQQAQVVDSFLELEVNDYVVHEQYGIGQYLGIVNRDGLDYLHITYANQNELYVPLQQVQLIRKYISKDGVGVKLSNLGTDTWKKTKAKVSQKVEEVAERLVSLYSQRQQVEGFAFVEDESQSLFDEDFPYEPTPDQLKAIASIKAEMAQPTPMDHLLCGDVGFGKTEVAMRAAYLAVSNGKQVALLCPTTILSMQHFQSFEQRFEHFGVNIALINRFVSAAKVKTILQQVQEGKVDIVIGTHALLNEKLKFQDLGLLIVDEEQRFGVMQKEKVKEWKTGIDVLSLSATPIPRTLQMGLIGLRSVSQLNTPPAKRHPIQTYVLEKHPNLIKEIIEKELGRNGQVFYLYNKVANIHSVARNLAKQFPDAKVGVVHGQMNREDIEEAMLRFSQHQYDILVCTTIIETGLDIANANTMIIENADHFGLAQLYQIRGRVGRRDKVAYCYLLTQARQQLSEIATKRLQAIQEFTKLGSGYRIAMRDLTIRGAGDLLGPAQAGFIDQVGLDLYLDMLGSAIKRKKGIVEQEVSLKKAQADMMGYVPDSMTDSAGDKLSLYQQIKSVTTLTQWHELEERLIDLYSRLPESVYAILYRQLLDIFANEKEVDSISQEGQVILIKLTKEYTSQCDGSRLFSEMMAIHSTIKLQLVKQQIVIRVVQNKAFQQLEAIMKAVRKGKKTNAS